MALPCRLSSVIVVTRAGCAAGDGGSGAHRAYPGSVPPRCLPLQLVLAVLVHDFEHPSCHGSRGSGGTAERARCKQDLVDDDRGRVHDERRHRSRHVPA
eukprot:6384898-Pyramimonas_sp.AAC.2